MRQLRRLRSSNVTEADLLEIEKSQKRRSDRPSALTLKEINLADKVFQWRNLNENIAASTDHLRELVRILKATKKPLDPIVVTPIGNRFFLLEGHHRLEAYRAAGWRKVIPVRYFSGTVREAQDEALIQNIKNKLQMSRAEKFDAAFRLIRQHTKTYEQIHDATTVSLRTINTMAEVLRECPDAAQEASWRRALWAYKKRMRVDDSENVGGDDWREKKAQKLAKQLVKNVGTGFVRDADVTARALEIIDGSLPSRLISQWPEMAADVLLDILHLENNEEAEAILRGMIYASGLSVDVEDVDL
jgi:ParB-like chromosome segregation protein Spo0J